MFRSQDIPVFVFLTIPWFTKSVMMNIGTGDRIHFWIYCLNHSSLSNQTEICQLIDMNKGNNFQESCEQFGGLDSKEISISVTFIM